MDLRTTKSGEFILLMPVSRRIDVTCCRDFKSRITDLVKQGNHFFLLDLSQVDFIDSSGLGSMISILKTVSKNNGDMVLCNLNPAVENLFTLTRMNTVFKTYSNEKEALESLIQIKNKLIQSRE
jgi:anti-sigma B factor antagonist